MSLIGLRYGMEMEQAPPNHIKDQIKETQGTNTHTERERERERERECRFVHLPS